VRLAIIGAVSVVVGAVIWIGMIGALMSPAKFKELSSEIQKTAEGIKQQAESAAEAPAAAPETTAQASGDQGVQPPQPAPAPAQAAAAPAEDTKGKLPPKIFIGEFHKGEVFNYWMQLGGPGFKREGKMKITVKSIDGEGATLAVTGEIEKVKGVFEQKVSWEMDLAAASETGLKTANVNQIFNILVSHRVKMHLLGSTAADLLPAELKNPRPMKVAGLVAEYFQGWGPVRGVANNQRTTFDIAVSKEHGFPLFLQGRNTGTEERIYLTLKDYKKGR